MSFTFTADKQIQQLAADNALYAVNFAQKHFGITLNWTDESVRQIEELLTKLDRLITKSDRSPEKIFAMAKVIGSYVGEVFRRNHGGEWGMIDGEGHKFVGLQHPNVGRFWPWGRVQDRLTEGLECNVWHYYEFLVEKSKPSC